MLLGSVVSSTDSASVFAVLRAKKLNLKGSLASLLEVESGSNDPMAYMLTLVVISAIKSGSSISLSSTLTMIISQMIIGFLAGVLIAKLTVYVLKHISLK